MLAEQRRLGPEPGALLALALFGGQPESQLDSAFSDTEWRAAVGDYVSAAVTLCLAVSDSPAHYELRMEYPCPLINVKPFSFLKEFMTRNA
jgi:hypothetical protein